MNVKYISSAEYFAREDTTRQIAKRLVVDGISFGVIERATGLSEKEIENFK